MDQSDRPNGAREKSNIDVKTASEAVSELGMSKFQMRRSEYVNPPLPNPRLFI